MDNNTLAQSRDANRSLARRTFTISMIFVLCLGMGQLSHGADQKPLKLSPEVRERCVQILQDGMHSDEFWPSIHAAEGLTLGGYGDEVIEYLTPKLTTEEDDQKRCGLAREIVRAGDRDKAQIMLEILAGEDPHGHVHAAESLYKVNELGDGVAMRKRFQETDDLRLKLMTAAALARSGDKDALAFLRKMLSHEDPELYKVAAWILGRIGDKTDILRIRRNLSRDADELTHAYHQHSLAALGDPAGMVALGKNLQSEDPFVRTYAATFAGDAGATQFADELIDMLDDPHLDARYRAAQSLLFLSRPVVE
ncbi:MAG: HEAT repeat domain-containing protein [Planctomycetaceae bacterium]|nr:HEAT repeat domain-containing protein [Planctomycetaceae bacterium]